MEDYPQLAIPMHIPIHMGQMIINNKKSSMKFTKKKVIRFGLGKKYKMKRIFVFTSFSELPPNSPKLAR
jgi:hypothetical protein